MVMHKAYEEDFKEIKLQIHESKLEAKNSTDLRVTFEVHFDRNNERIQIVMREVNKKGKAYYINQLIDCRGATQELELLASILNHITNNKIEFDDLALEQKYIDTAKFIIKRLEKLNIKNIIMTKD